MASQPFESFAIQHNTFIVATREISTMDIKSFLEKKVRRREFPKGAVLKIFTGMVARWL